MKNKKVLGILILAIIGIVLINGCIKQGAEEKEKQETEMGIEWFQRGNTLPITQLQPKESRELEDNRIGTDLLSYDPGYHNPEVVYPIGFKWMRISANIDPLNWQYVETEPGEYSIDPTVNDIITEYASNGINIVLNLGVGAGENRPDTTRFKTEEDVERYCNFARFMVHHFKDRIRYYEIWNEPDTNTPWGRIALEDYVKLIQHVVPVIRQGYPEAKIVVGATGGTWVSDFPGYENYSRYTLHIDYLKNVIKSGVAPLVDVISWHPFYGHRPDDPYYQNYPQMVKEIQDLAASQGFKGEYLVEEILWRTPSGHNGMHQPVTEIVAAKYFARSIVMNRGLDLITSIALPGAHDPTLPKVRAIHNICDTMAGAEPTSLPIEIQSEATNIRSYGFSLPNGDTLIALWTDGAAVDDDPGVEVKLIIKGLADQDVVGIDVLEGYQQPIITSSENGNLVIQNLIVRDYPLILHITKSST